MSAIETEHFGTVNDMLGHARTRAHRESIAELERLCGHAYSRAYGLEPGLRTAISAIKRLLDSRVIRVADPDESDWVEVVDEVPNEIGSTHRVSRAPGVDAACRVCGRDYRHSAGGPFVCVHAQGCPRGQRLVAGGTTLVREDLRRSA